MTKLFARFIAVAALLSILGACGAAPEAEAPSTGPENGEFTAQLNGFNIFYRVAGRGPVCMVMPNSWGLSHEGLRALFEPLEKSLTMVYFDPRGIGRSDDIRTDMDMSMAAVRQDLDALARHLELDRVHLIGWSNGGMNLLLFAAEHPETVDRAIVLHAAAYFGEEEMKDRQKRFPEAMKAYGTFMEEMASTEAGEQEKTAKYKEFIIKEYFTWLFTDRESAAQFLAEAYEDTEFSWRHSQYSNDVDGSSFDARPELGKITAPTLIIAGANDMIPQSTVQETAWEITNSSYVLFRQSAHFSPIEEQEKFAATVLQFLGLETGW